MGSSLVFSDLCMCNEINSLSVAIVKYTAVSVHKNRCLLNYLYFAAYNKEYVWMSLANLSVISIIRLLYATAVCSTVLWIHIQFSPVTQQSVFASFILM